MQDSIMIVDTGCANFASIRAAFKRQGFTTEVSDDPNDLLRAQAVVLPGVGSFEVAMRKLNQSGLAQALRDYVINGKALLSICLGMQLLLEGSEESPGVAGLGIVPGFAKRFSKNVPVPQLGWNVVSSSDGELLQEEGSASFANSYRLIDAPNEFLVSWSEHDGPFVAALEQGPLLACQFHPELSGDWGERLLTRWLVKATQGRVSSC